MEFWFVGSLTFASLERIRLRSRKKMARIKKFFKDESGASAVEYCLLVGLIALVLIGAVTTLGDVLQAKFQEASDLVAAAS
jgi:pilus assembly protein Flp/PilA